MSPDGGPNRDRLRLAFFGDANSVHVRRWLTFFAGRGHQVILCLATNQKLVSELPAAIRVERFTPFSARGRFPPASRLRARWQLRRLMARIEPDLVNGHYLNPHGWHAWLSGYHPCVVTLWGSDVFITPKTLAVAAKWGRATLAAADMVMVNSEALRRGAIELGAAPEKTELIGWGVDTTRFSPGPDPVELRARLNLQGRRVVLSPRSITPIYRQEVVAATLAQLPADVSLVMLRHHCDPALLAAIENQVQAAGVADRLLIVPHIEDGDMPDLMRLADVVVSVPASDSTSSTILEALACGRQIVAGNLPSVREWLGDLDPEALVPIDDVPATAAALVRALNRDPAERERLGRAARAIAEQRADQAKSLGRVESLYLDLVRRSGRYRGATKS
jgi:L-malate glycosyltransferase